MPRMLFLPHFSTGEAVAFAAPFKFEADSAFDNIRQRKTDRILHCLLFDARPFFWGQTCMIYQTAPWAKLQWWPRDP
eukprot:8127306-Lingulodinium_polyedra.AAC.1